MSGYFAIGIEEDEEEEGGEEVTLNLLVNPPIPTTLPVSPFYMYLHTHALHSWGWLGCFIGQNLHTAVVKNI